MKSVMTHQFSRVPEAEIQRSSFDRSHGYKTTFDGGWLVPFYVDEALPGDTFNLRAAAFCRLATPIKPFMDNLFLETFFFFVPNRLLWENWERFNGAQDDPDDSVDFSVPHLHGPAYGAGGIAVGSLGDYMGLPTGPLDATNPGIQFNALHFRAYNLIWNTWFRDQNLQDSVAVKKGDTGDDTYADYALLRRGKRHDYFTSCLPWPQKGPDVVLPLGTSAPVRGIAKGNDYFATGPAGSLRESTGTMATYAKYIQLGDPETANREFLVEEHPAHAGYPHVWADLSQAVAATVNSLREAFQLQRLHERDARGGTRYTEIIKAHFGVTSPDARLQRPEYLGGGSTNINIHPVTQNAPAPGAGPNTPQGNLAAFGVGSFNGHGFSKSFTEHGVLLGLMSVRADLTYQQGLNRMWSRTTRYDYYWPALSHLGEQAVLTKELYCMGKAADDEDVFGYQERYAEYRYKPSQVTGKFRSTDATPLDMWHLSQEFMSKPELSDEWISDTADVAIDRVIAVNTEPQFLIDMYLSLKCARPMPVYGVPGMMDHL